MPLIVKIKNPKGGKVSITSVNGDGGSDRHIYVKIRLPKSKLEKLEGESDLSSLEDELNQVLTAQDVENMAHRFHTPTKNPQLPPALNRHGSNNENSSPTPKFNVTLTYSPQKLSQSNDNSPLSSSGSKVSDVTKITQPDMQPLNYNKIPVSVTGDDKLDNDDQHQVTVKNEMVSQTSDKPATKEEVPNPNATTGEAGFRNIPPNLMTMLKREFELLNGTEEEIEMIDKIIFTLRDPLSASKIKLPIKSINCSHFECFDFENFCEFNKVPMGIRNVLKKDLISKANELKKQDKLQQGNGKELSHNKHINMIQLTKNFMYNPPVSEFKRNFGGFAPHYPTYKCPVCNVAFELNQLFISDIFNYFIKTSPMDIDRIELIDMSKYRIVDNAPRPQKKTVTQEVVLLDSEDESDDGDNTRDSIDNEDKSSGNGINQNDNQNTNQNNNNNDTNDPNSTNNNFNIHINPIFQSFDDPNPKRLPSIAEIMRKVNANNTQNSVKSSTEIPGFSSDETEEEDYGMVPPPPRNYKNLDPFDDDEFDSLLDRPTFVNSPYKGSGSWEDPVTID